MCLLLLEYVGGMQVKRIELCYGGGKILFKNISPKKGTFCHKAIHKNDTQHYINL